MVKSEQIPKDLTINSDIVHDCSVCVNMMTVAMSKTAKLVQCDYHYTPLTWRQERKFECGSRAKLTVCRDCKMYINVMKCDYKAGET